MMPWTLSFRGPLTPTLLGSCHPSKLSSWAGSLLRPLDQLPHWSPTHITLSNHWERGYLHPVLLFILSYPTGSSTKFYLWTFAGETQAAAFMNPSPQWTHTKCPQWSPCFPSTWSEWKAPASTTMRLGVRCHSTAHQQLSPKPSLLQEVLGDAQTLESGDTWQLLYCSVLLWPHPKLRE